MSSNNSDISNLSKAIGTDIYTGSNATISINGANIIYGGLVGGGGHTAYYDPTTGTVYHTYGGPNSPTDIQVTWSNSNLIGQMIFSKEEQQRLDAIVKDRNEATKKKKLQYFKELPPDYRQSVIDRFTWSEHVAKMNAIEEEMSQEEKDLVAKRSSVNVLGGYSIGSYTGTLSMYGWNMSAPELPKDITSQDLIKAHLEATTEELIENRSE